MNVLYERGVGIESENLVMGTGRSTQCDRGGAGIKLKDRPEGEARSGGQ